MAKVYQCPETNSALESLVEVQFNGFVLRNCVNQAVSESCICSQKYKVQFFLVITFTQTETFLNLLLFFCQKVLKQWLNIIHSSLLWIIIADARLGHAFSSWACVSCPFIRGRQHQVVTDVPNISHRCLSIYTSNNERKEQEEMKKEGRGSDCHLPLHSTAFYSGMSGWILFSKWLYWRSGGNGGRESRFDLLMLHNKSPAYELFAF